MKRLIEVLALAHYAKDKDNIVTTDASRTALGITLGQKQADCELKQIAFGSKFLNELLAVVWGSEKFRFYSYGKKCSYTLTTEH